MRSEPSRRSGGSLRGGTSLGEECSDNIKKKPAHSLLKTIGILVPKTFNVLIMFCNNGQHRSVALANDIAHEVGAKLIAPPVARPLENVTS